jgi:hypothetical protein
MKFFRSSKKIRFLLQGALHLNYAKNAIYILEQF